MKIRGVYMKLMDKLKNALFEEEYVEIEEKPKKVKEHKPKKEENKVKITNYDGQGDPASHSPGHRTDVRAILLGEKLWIQTEQKLRNGDAKTVGLSE